MKQTITETGFISAFLAAGRETQFSVAARQALWDYYAELEEELGEDIELDVIAICCDWGEYTLAELRSDYPDQVGDTESLDEAAEQLSEYTTVLHVEGAETILVQVF